MASHPSMKLTVPHATEARQIVNQGRYERAQKQLELVDSVIREAIRRGCLEASGDGNLDDAVVNALREKGYSVEHHSARNEECWIVRW